MWRNLETNEVIVNDENFVVGEDGSLILTNPRGENRGNYQCLASNPVGRDIRVVSLEVYSKKIVLYNMCKYHTFLVLF